MSFNSGYNGNGLYGANQNFICHMKRFIGETVLVFTTSGGQSGSGFSGVLMEVNGDFIRLVTQQSQPPTCPISNVCEREHDYCNGYENGTNGNGNGLAGEYTNYNNYNLYRPNVGSVCDIPIDRIAAFCHNAV
jgi:hypothetical protein